MRREIGQQEAAPAVEEAAPPEEEHEEARGRAHDHVREVRPPALGAHRLGHDRGVAVDRAQVIVEAAVGLVAQLAREPAHPARDLRAVVRIAPAPAAAAPVEQAQLPVGIPGAVADPAAEVARHARHLVARGARELAAALRLDRRAQLGRHALVGVDAEHPVVARRAHRERARASRARSRARRAPRRAGASGRWSANRPRAARRTNRASRGRGRAGPPRRA